MYLGKNLRMKFSVPGGHIQHFVGSSVAHPC
jgi:hypothetical protein